MNKKKSVDFIDKMKNNVSLKGVRIFFEENIFIEYKDCLFFKKKEEDVMDVWPRYTYR